MREPSRGDDRRSRRSSIGPALGKDPTHPHSDVPIFLLGALLGDQPQGLAKMAV
jgi:hypothetical protein